MFQIGIIVFREILEIALILGILSAATKGIKGKNKLILLGLALGIIGSVSIALFTDSISESFDGIGQEIFSATILLLSSLMISWTVIWMKKHAYSISANLKQLGKSVASGDKPLFALLPIVAFSVLREGTEIVLFSYGAFISGSNISNLIFGALAGLILGIIVGFAIYYGLLKTFGKYFFAATSWILIFLCAGMVAAALGFLSQAGVVPEIKYPLWDSSFLIAENGIIGTILNILIGYISRPSAIQVIGYGITLLFLIISINSHKLFFKAVKIDS